MPESASTTGQDADKAKQAPKRKVRNGPRSRTSPYLGVSRVSGAKYKNACHWEAHIWDSAAEGGSGRQLHLGSFLSVQQAAKAYDRAALLFRGPHAELNQPAEVYDNDPELTRLRQFQKKDIVMEIRKIQEDPLPMTVAPACELPPNSPRRDAPAPTAASRKKKKARRAPSAPATTSNATSIDDKKPTTTATTKDDEEDDSAHDDDHDSDSTCGSDEEYIPVLKKKDRDTKQTTRAAGSGIPAAPARRAATTAARREKSKATTAGASDAAAAAAPAATASAGSAKNSAGAAPIAAAADVDAGDKDAAAAAAPAVSKFRVSVKARTQTGVPKAVVAEATAQHATHTKKSRTTDDNKSTNTTTMKTTDKATPPTEPAVRGVETKVLPARGDAPVTHGRGKGAHAYALLASAAATAHEAAKTATPAAAAAAPATADTRTKQPASDPKAATADTAAAAADAPPKPLLAGRTLTSVADVLGAAKTAGTDQGSALHKDTSTRQGAMGNMGHGSMGSMGPGMGNMGHGSMGSNGYMGQSNMGSVGTAGYMGNMGQGMVPMGQGSMGYMGQGNMGYMGGGSMGYMGQSSMGYGYTGGMGYGYGGGMGYGYGGMGGDELMMMQCGDNWVLPFNNTNESGRLLGWPATQGQVNPVMASPARPAARTAPNPAVMASPQKTPRGRDLQQTPTRHAYQHAFGDPLFSPGDNLFSPHNWMRSQPALNVATAPHTTGPSGMDMLFESPTCAGLGGAGAADAGLWASPYGTAFVPMGDTPAGADDTLNSPSADPGVILRHRGSASSLLPGGPPTRPTRPADAADAASPARHPLAAAPAGSLYGSTVAGLSPHRAMADYTASITTTYQNMSTRGSGGGAGTGMIPVPAHGLLVRPFGTGPPASGPGNMQHAGLHAGMGAPRGGDHGMQHQQQHGMGGERVTAGRGLADTRASDATDWLHKVPVPPVTTFPGPMGKGAKGVIKSEASLMPPPPPQAPHVPQAATQQRSDMVMLTKSPCVKGPPRNSFATASHKSDPHNNNHHSSNSNSMALLAASPCASRGKQSGGRASGGRPPSTPLPVAAPRAPAGPASADYHGSELFKGLRMPVQRWSGGGMGAHGTPASQGGVLGAVGPTRMSFTSPDS